MTIDKKINKIKKLLPVLVPMIVIVALFIPIIVNISEHYYEIYEKDVAEKLSIEIGKINKEIDEDTLLAFVEEHKEELIIRSEDSANHFWYDITNKQIIYTTYDILTEKEVAQNVNFRSNSLRNGLLNGFYLLDQEGNRVVEYIDILENRCTYDKYVQIVKALRSDDYISDESLFAALHSRLNVTAIINDFGIFALSSQKIEYVYISPLTSMLGNIENLYGSGILNISNVDYIKLPKNVKVPTKGLVNYKTNYADTSGMLYGSTELHVSAKEEELSEIFSANSTNCVIVCDGNRYIIENEKIINLPNKVIYDSLQYSQSTSKFKVSLDGEITEEKVEIFDNTLCIAYDINEFKLKVSEFDLEEDKLSSPLKVEWEVGLGNEYLECTDKQLGIFRIKQLQPIDDAGKIEIWVTESTNKNQKITHIVEVKIARIIGVNLQKEMGSDIRKEEDKFILVSSKNNNSEWTFNMNFIQNPDMGETSVRCEENVSVSFENEGIFGYKIKENKLILRLIEEEFLGTNTININCGEETYSFDIELIDESNCLFGISDVADVESYGITYHIGNKNPIRLDTLFKSNLNVNSDRIKIECYDTDGSNTELTPNKDYFITKNNNWATTTIKFAEHVLGEFLISISTTDGAFVGKTTILVDVVSAYNVTDVYSWKKAKNKIVLLNDIDLGDKLDNEAKELVYLYGNYHKIDASSYEYKSTTVGDAKFIGMVNGLMECTIIEGPIFDELILTYKDNANGKYTAGLRLEGTTTINNCYISGFRNPIRINNGNIVFNNTTIKNGTFANIWVMDATSITFNGGKTIQTMIKEHIGAGIIINPNYTMDGVNINTSDGFTQYNFISEEDTNRFGGGLYKLAFAEIFENYPEYVHEKNNVKYINSGILLPRELVVDDLDFEYVLGTLNNRSIVGYRYSKLKLFNSIFGQVYETNHYGDIYSPGCYSSCNHRITPNDMNQDGLYDYTDFLIEIINSNK